MKNALNLTASVVETKKVHNEVRITRNVSGEAFVKDFRQRKQIRCCACERERERERKRERVVCLCVCVSERE